MLSYDGTFFYLFFIYFSLSQIQGLKLIGCEKLLVVCCRNSRKPDKPALKASFILSNHLTYR